MSLFGFDANGDLVPIPDPSCTFDTLWQQDEICDLMPLGEPRDLNYPVEEDVRKNVVYGFANQFVGELVPILTEFDSKPEADI